MTIVIPEWMTFVMMIMTLVPWFTLIGFYIYDVIQEDRYIRRQGTIR